MENRIAGINDELLKLCNIFGDKNDTMTDIIRRQAGTPLTSPLARWPGEGRQMVSPGKYYRMVEREEAQEVGLWI
jgi:hypothetical protein